VARAGGERRVCGPGGSAEGEGQLSPGTVKTVEAVLGLYPENYYDLNARHFPEKLHQEHEISLSYSWVYQALVGAGLV
jgi:hypothetical protein